MFSRKSFTSSILFNFFIYRIEFFSLINFYIHICIYIYYLAHSPRSEKGVFLFILCRKGVRYETCVTLGSGGGRVGTARTRNDGTCVHMK